MDCGGWVRPPPGACHRARVVPPMAAGSVQNKVSVGDL
jgi:hypothetical protein